MINFEMHQGWNSYESSQLSFHAGLLSEKQTTTDLPHPKSWITPRTLSDFTIGLSDGLTVPFALTAGLSALGNGEIIISAGLAELVAGAISMGVAGYLAAKGERDAQFLASQRTRSMIRAEPEEVLALIRAKFQGFYLPHDILDTIVDHFSKQPSEKLSHILLQLEENGEGTQLLRPWVSGVTIAAAYFFGGFIPLLPYLFATVSTAFTISVIITAIVLFTFGCTKSLLAGSCQELRVCLKSGFEMLVLGGLAAAAALTCVKALNQFRNP